uniref:Isoleucine--tRNA ligase cytoplasmic ubiquitin-like domain-containing protein n=1 Tax=Xiphophorus couchianus TaxID=32473 RepID=A0A3B5ME83_9TELE
MVLGKRLKGAFKAVTASIKELTSEQLEAFQKTGSIVVDGHELHEEDLRLMYTFDQTSGSAAQYEAHSDAQVLVLLDVTPDQSMVDEGVAREVINRIQKLRKKAHLVPSDEISVYYRCQPEGEYLGSVIEAHTDFILATTKAPLLPFPVPKTASVIIEEKTQLKGSDLAFTIVKGSSLSQTPPNGPACAYVNLRVKVNNTEQGKGVVLLENPKGDNRLDLDKLRKVCSSIFGINNTQLRFFSDQTDLQTHSGKTLLVTSGPSSPGAVPTADTLLCPYVNLLLCNAQPAECQAGDVGTLLLVNPVGQNELDHSGLLSEAAKVFGLRSRRLKLYLDQDFTTESSVKSLHTKTLYVRVFPTTAEA